MIAAAGTSVVVVEEVGGGGIVVEAGGGGVEGGFGGDECGVILKSLLRRISDLEGAVESSEAPKSQYKCST